MKKEILKGFSMLLLIVGLALATAVVSANGKSANRVVANIPFDFVVGNNVLPAGEYSVMDFTQGGRAVIIRSAKTSQIRLANELSPNRRDQRARLVFHRYGQNYFLAEIWSGGEEAGRLLAPSRKERAIQRELASAGSKSELADNTYETVELLASVR